MKELSIKEKAELYDKALERAKNTIEVNQAVPDIVECIESLFPELKESKDEKIRKELLAVINDLVLPDDQQSRFINWIEKQGEHANFRNKIQIGDKVTRNEAGVLVNLSQLKRVAKKQGEQETFCDKCRKEQPYQSCQDIRTLGKCALEKQSKQKPIKEHDICDTCDEKESCVTPCPVKLVEQKSTDKVEPKFKVGDTIAKKHNSDIHDFGSFTITDITGGKYWYNGRIICDISEQDEWEIYEPVRQNSFVWSKEDEEMLNDIIMCGERHCYLDVGNITWLKLLKEKYIWKPSDEQMDTLRIAVATSNNIVLYSLYNDLEKLKG